MVDEKDLRRGFKDYLNDKVSNGKLSVIDANTQYSDADYPRKHAQELGLDYFEMFKTDKDFEQALDLIKLNFEKNGKKNTTFLAYKRALLSFRDFYLEYLKNHTKKLSVKAWFIRSNYGEYVQDFLEKQVVGIGWLRESYEGKSREAIKNCILKECPNEKQGTIDQWAGCCWRFACEIKVNDYVITNNNDGTIHIGKIIGEYEYSPDFYKENPHIRSVKWIKKIERKTLPANIQSYLKSSLTVTSFDDSGAIKCLEEICKQNSNKEQDMTKIPLNQILYGPPGTGKTYNTVIKAIEITNPELIQRDENGNVKNYKVLKEKFDELKQQGQIEFVTFHQSYSYEEFVEGIKPDISKWNDEGSELKYIGKDGIFKNICEHAKPVKVSSVKHQPIDFSNTKVFKMSLGNTLEKEDDIYEFCISNDVVALGFKDVDFSDCKTSQDFKDKDDSWGATALERFINWMDIGDIIIVSNGNRNFRAIAQVTGDYYYDRTTPIRYSHFRKVEWLYKGEDIYYSKINNKVFSQQSIYGYFDPNKKGMSNYNQDLNTQELNNIITGKVDKEIALPHILIIDEINRGDVSKIFGELITLIEEDKRIGKEHQMTVTLPYSREPFGVPNNLYIIGTMNTADRSIALLDTALRRRFDFEEMMPKPELLRGKDIEGIDLEQLLTQINDRIKNEYDRDHQIGHSYLMGVENKEQLERAYKNRILPLLNEYFYNDIDSVAKILNCKPNEITSKENWFNVLKEAQKPTKKENEQ